jgi:hypothetical protein
MYSFMYLLFMKKASAYQKGRGWFHGLGVYGLE